MRLPVSKVYRAFQELDGFSDEQCEAYVSRARKNKVGSGVLMAGLALLSFCLVGSVGAAVVLLVQRYLVSARIVRSDNDQLVVGVIGVIVFITMSAIGGLVVRDLWLRRAIRIELCGTRCPRCAYQLLGLPVVNNSVRCPECGLDSRLIDLEIRPEDLVMPIPE